MEKNSSSSNCDDALNLTLTRGSYLDESLGGYKEDAIEKIKWYSWVSVHRKKDNRNVKI